MSKDEIAQYLKDAFVSVGTNAVLAYLKVHLPFFNLPVVSYALEVITRKLMQVVANSVEMAAYFTYVDHVTAIQAHNFEKAAKDHKTNPSTDTERALVDAARALIRLRG